MSEPNAPTPVTPPTATTPVTPPTPPAHASHATHTPPPAPPPTPAKKKKLSLVRSVGPVVPLAIPLAMSMLHGAATGNGTPQTAAIPDSIKTRQLAMGPASPGAAPMPMVSAGNPVDWFFVFKLNSTVFKNCGTPESDGSATLSNCQFDKDLNPAKYALGEGLRYVVATSKAPALVDGGPQCLGSTTDDPVGATFSEVYNGNFHYLLWNDQFDDTKPNPPTPVLNCSKGNCDAPWGHSKGMLAWNDAGEGFVMQVSTPSWPGSGTSKIQRSHGNSLGCIVSDDDVKVSQHFFALKLTEPDLVQVLKALNQASIATDPTNPQVANIGGPPEVIEQIQTLGVKSKQATLDPSMPFTLSSGVKLIAKPSDLNVPPWQLVSAVLGEGGSGIPLRTATWWDAPYIPTTATAAAPGCWDDSIPRTPGPVAIATEGTWNKLTFSVTSSGNHAKLGVSTGGTAHYAIFGDENQQGTLVPSDGSCVSSQNGRGGTFYAMDNAALQASLLQLLGGSLGPTATAGTTIPGK